jgi:hypothetical protein
VRLFGLSELFIGVRSESNCKSSDTEGGVGLEGRVCGDRLC